MAVERDTFTLVANTAQTVTLTEAYTVLEVVVTSITSADTVVIYGNTVGATAVAEADELDAVAGGIGAFNRFTARPGTTTISLIANAACKVLVKRLS